MFIRKALETDCTDSFYCDDAQIVFEVRCRSSLSVISLIMSPIMLLLLNGGNMNEPCHEKIVCVRVVKTS